MNISAALQMLEARLSSVTDDALWEARTILEEATGLERPVLFAHPEREVAEDAWRKASAMTERRLKTEPLPYILGKWEFFGRSFRVTPSVLIPRPETELLVERALAWLKLNPDVQKMADVGCGSGCIGLTLLCEDPSLLFCTALDISQDALAVASENANLLGCSSRWRGLQSDLTAVLNELPPLICANLPYIPTETCDGLEVTKHEPRLALDGGPDGFELYRLLFSDLRHKMECAEGRFLILCEIEYRQKELALLTAKEFFPTARYRVLNDLAGLPRLLEVEIQK